MNKDVRKQERPLFSIIVPVYNNEHDLVKCIQSILAQIYKNFELILVDDGSTDRSPKICNWYADKDSRILAIHKKNGGAAAARNEGLRLSKGKYIYYVDADDWISKTLLEKAHSVLAEENPPDIFVFRYCEIVKNGKCIKSVLHVKEGLYNKKRLEREVYPYLIRGNGKIFMKMGIDNGSLANKIIARDLLVKHFCRNTSLFYNEDSVCSFECMYYADKVFFSNAVLYYYNRLSESSNQKKYHGHLFENNMEAVQYLRLRLGRNIHFKRQIDILEADGIARAVLQEAEFHHSYQSIRFLRKKISSWVKFSDCLKKGLPFIIRIYLLFLNLNWHYFVWIYAKLCVWKKQISELP